MKKYPPPISIRRARALRNSPTEAERALWNILREKFADAHFRRQVPIHRFICDFASHRHHLVIEADGGQHGGVNDQGRDASLNQEGYRVLRFWNTEILNNPDGVAERIAEYLANGSAAGGF